MMADEHCTRCGEREKYQRADHLPDYWICGTEVEEDGRVLCRGGLCTDRVEAAANARNAALTEALEWILPPKEFRICADWWCPSCRAATYATYTEHCSTCGTYLTNCQPSREWIEKAKAALAGGAK